MRITFTLLIALACLASQAAAQDSRPGALEVKVPTFHNEKCPVMEKPVKTTMFVETPHGRIYMCCKACTKKIEADPEAMYKKAYPAAKAAGNKTCPVSGETLGEKPTMVSIQGYDIGLCCGDCAKGALDNSQIILAKLANPKIKDVGNTTSPVSGKPVQNNTFVMIGDDLVHLAAADEVAAVEKDPKAALDKAKAGKGEKKDGPEKGGPHGGCCSEKKAEGDAGCCSGEKKSEGSACCGGAVKAAASKPAK